MVRTCAGVVADGCQHARQEGGCQDTWACAEGSRATLGLCLPMALRPMLRRQRAAERHSEGSLGSWHGWQRTVRHGDPLRVAPTTPRGRLRRGTTNTASASDETQRSAGARTARLSDPGLPAYVSVPDVRSQASSWAASSSRMTRFRRPRCRARRTASIRKLNVCPQASVSRWYCSTPSLL